jgi:PAS domain S-box-containing protein
MTAEREPPRAEPRSRRRTRRSPLRGRLRALFDALPVEAWLLDPSTLAIVDCNAVAQRTTLFTREDLAGKPLRETDVEASAELMRELATRVTAGELVQVATHDKTKDGRARDIEVRLQAFPVGLRGRPLVLGVLTDVTERRRWEERLKASEERFRALFEAAPFAAIVTSLDDLRIVDCNQAYAELLGYERCDLIDQAATSVAPDLTEDDMRALTAATQAGQIVRVETRVRTRTGALKEVIYAGRNLVIDDRPLAYGTLVDITERKRTEEELRAAAGFEKRVLGIVSHDLREPLTAIGLQAQAMLRDPALPATVRSAFERIATTTRRAGRMIRDLLDFTRARHEQAIPVRPRPVDLAEVLRQVVAEVGQGFPDLHVRLVLDGDLHGTWDADRLAQVAANLLANAAKHGRTGAPVDVVATGEGDAVCFSVHNEGPPIPPAVLAHVFEPFRQAGGDADAKGGVGLGLFIIRHLVEAHHGTVTVTSSDDAGTTFAVRLPRGGA